MTNITYTQYKVGQAGEAYMLICDGECDQIVGSMAQAKKERADLVKMGLDNVRIKRFDTWAEAEAYEDKLRGW